jgi:hypothetical protein
VYGIPQALVLPLLHSWHYSSEPSGLYTLSSQRLTTVWVENFEDKIFVVLGLGYYYKNFEDLNFRFTSPGTLGQVLREAI